MGGYHVTEPGPANVPTWLPVGGFMAFDASDPDNRGEVPTDTLPLILAYPCGPHCREAHLLGLYMPVEVAGLLVAIVEYQARCLGAAAALTSARDQAAATIAEHRNRLERGEHGCE